MNPAILALLAARVAAPASGSFDFMGAYGSAADGASATFSAVDIGAADASRVIIVAVTLGGGAKSVTGVTIGGVAATLDVIGTSGSGRTAIARASVPSGTTANIVVTGEYQSLRKGIAVYRSVGYTVAVAGTGSVLTNATTASVNVSTTSGGAVVAITHPQSTGATTAWSGVTEDYDLTDMGGEATTWSGGHATGTTGGTLAVGVTYAVTPAASTQLTAAAYTLT